MTILKILHSFECIQILFESSIDEKMIEKWEFRRRFLDVITFYEIIYFENSKERQNQYKSGFH